MLKMHLSAFFNALNEVLHISMVKSIMISSIFSLEY